jgi:hypothetical protein
VARYNADGRAKVPQPETEERMRAPAWTTLQLLQQAREAMGLASAVVSSSPLNEADADEPKTGLRLAAARCWALLLVRVFDHIAEPTQPPAVLPAPGIGGFGGGNLGAD